MTKLLKPIQYQTYIDVPVENVYKLLTTAEGWDSWFTNGMSLDLENKIIKFKWDSFGGDRVTAKDSGSILKLIENEYFSFTWHEGSQIGETKVEFTITEKSNGTLLNLKDSGYPDTEVGMSWFVDCSAGWGEALTLMKVFLETGYVYKNY